MPGKQLSFEERKEVDRLKQKIRIDFENLRHKNRMVELEKELEIARASNSSNGKVK